MERGDRKERRKKGSSGDRKEKGKRKRGHRGTKSP